MRVFLDANVLFSISDLQSKTAITLARLVLQNHEAVTNFYAWDEAWRNVNNKRPHLRGIEAFQDRITILDTFTPPLPLDIVCAEKDVPILAGAIDAQCTHLWTGDKAHLGQYYGRRIQGVMVVSGSMMYELLVGTS